MPSPYTSTRTPWRVIRSASETESELISAAINSLVGHVVRYSGVSCFCTSVYSSGKISRLVVTTTATTSWDK